MGHVRTQLNIYVYMYLDSIEGTEYIADLFLVYMIYVTMGRFGIEILCLSMFNFHHIFSLYILSIDLLNKCQWHLILYILLLVLDSYNIMNHYFLYLFKWVPKYHYGPNLKVHMLSKVYNLWHQPKSPYA